MLQCGHLSIRAGSSTALVPCLFTHCCPCLLGAQPCSQRCVLEKPSLLLLSSLFAMVPAVNLPAPTAALGPQKIGDNRVDAPGRPGQAAEESAGFQRAPAPLPAGSAGDSEPKQQGATNGSALEEPEVASLAAAGASSSSSDALPHSTVAAWAGAYAAAAEAGDTDTSAGHPVAAASSGQHQQPQLLRRLSSNSRTPPLSLTLLRSLSARRRPDVWGWLRPAAGTKLPFVLLQGKGVALGRGRDAYYERLPQLLFSRASSFSMSPHSFPSLGSSSGHVSGPPDSGSLPSATSINMPSSVSTAARTAGSSGGTCGGASANSSVALGAPGGAAGATASPFAAVGEGDKDSAFVEVPDGRVSRLHAWVKWDSTRQQAVLEVRAGRGPSVRMQGSV